RGAQERYRRSRARSVGSAKAPPGQESEIRSRTGALFAASERGAQTLRDGTLVTRPRLVDAVRRTHPSDWHAGAAPGLTADFSAPLFAVRSPEVCDLSLPVPAVRDSPARARAGARAAPEARPADARRVVSQGAGRVLPRAPQRGAAAGNRR